MKTTVLLLSSCVTSGLLAQPVLTSAGFTPPVGATFTYNGVNYVPPGPATANFNFVVSSSSTGNPSTATVVSPSTTPYWSSFPNSTFAFSSGTAPDLNYNYGSVNSTSLLEWGSQNADFAFVYSDPKLDLPLPCSMGTTWTDSFSGTGTGFSTTTETGTITGHYNGYGTLVLPFGTFTNVARVETDEASTTGSSGPDSTTSISNTVSYFIQGFSQWIFQTGTSTYNFPGQPSLTVQGSGMIDPASVGITESKGNGLRAMVFPNPASDAVTVNFTAPVNEKVSITLLDAVGRVVIELTPSWSNPTTLGLDVSSVPRGMYMVRVTDADGRSSNTPLVLN